MEDVKIYVGPWVLRTEGPVVDGTRATRGQSRRGRPSQRDLQRHGKENRNYKRDFVLGDSSVSYNRVQ